MKREKGSDRISTFIGADASIDGNIEFKGTIRVDGTVKGKISSNSGTVVVGEKAVVNAEVNVNVAVIMGELNGTVNARERIEVYPPGRVGGDIHAPVISIEPGAIFNGNCEMKKQPSQAVKPAFFVKNQPPGEKSNVK
jgi:cytoskeletal protein CcmA (bactofilin family)